MLTIGFRNNIDMLLEENFKSKKEIPIPEISNGGEVP